MYTVPSGAIAAAPFSGQPRVLPLIRATVNVIGGATVGPRSAETWPKMEGSAQPPQPGAPPKCVMSTYACPRPSDATAGSQSSPDGKPITRGVAKLPPPAAWAVSDNVARDTITPTETNKRDRFCIENPLRGKGNLAIRVRRRSAS